MNPEIKEKWLIELGSGNYQKGRRKLKHVEGGKVQHCCLGVLCELYIKETGLGEWKEHANGIMVFILDGKESRDYLPEKVMAWSGVENFMGEFEFPAEEEMDDLMKVLRRDYNAINLVLVNDIREGLPHHDPGYDTVKGYIKKYF